MPLSKPRSRNRESTVHCATQGPPSHALQGATVEGVGIAHGCPPALGAQQHCDKVPALKAAGPNRRSRLALCRLSADTLKLGLGLLGISSLARMGGNGIKGIQAVPSWPSGLNPARRQI